MTDKISQFQGAHRWLSNFWQVPILFEGFIYASVEHAYVAAKTTDPAVREQVRCVTNPGSVKRFGRKIDVRPDWDEIRLATMEQLVRAKFADKRLRALLISTGVAHIEEGNHWGDTFWGVDLRGNGENHLGKIIMKIRAEIVA